MNGRAARQLLAVVAAAAVIACGDVPTLESGIAYISPIVLPAPAVAIGDTLRDSLGRVVPLSVIAYDRSNAIISGVTASYLVSTLPAELTITPSNTVVGLDSISTAQIVARIGDRLQTPASSIEVVAQPDSITASGILDSLQAFTASSALQASVTGPHAGTRVQVKGIVVHYRIANIYPAQAVTAQLVVFARGLKTDLTQATDTTTTNPGFSSETITITSVQGVDSVAVEAAANNLRGVPLGGSPVRFVLHVRKGS